MPIYEFHCPSCGRDFEELVRSAAAGRSAACPDCGRKDAERKLSVFAAHSAGPAARCPMSDMGACGQRCNADGACDLT